jgi:hypothetical protein
MYYMIAISTAVKTPVIKLDNNVRNSSPQYSLTQQMIDPFSSSPPNIFISNLKTRMFSHNLFINDANRKSE